MQNVLWEEKAAPEANRCQGEACLLPTFATTHLPGAPGPPGAATSLPGSGRTVLGVAGRSGPRSEPEPWQGCQFKQGGLGPARCTLEVAA